MEALVSKMGAWARVAAAVLMLLSLGWGSRAQAAETTTYVLTDVQGTVLAREDAQGNIIARYDHRPYGKQQTGPVAAGPGYTGHVEDPDTGLVYMQQRYYDPEVGRFLSIDSVGTAPGIITKFNRFVYANNNPINMLDPDGRDAIVTMMFRERNILFGLGYNHEFVEIRDTESSRVVIASAGPSGDYPPEYGLINASADDGSGSPMTLQAYVGPIEGSREEGGENKRLINSSVTLKKSFDEVVKKASAIKDAVNKSKIVYLPKTTNSNAYANMTYQSLTGVTPPQQDFAKGAQTKLPIKDCPATVCAELKK